MVAQPQTEHQWLENFMGEWRFEHDCRMPDGTLHQASGTMRCHMLGKLWLICESQSGSGEDAWSSIMTLGFDPTTNKYRGTFVGSMMTHLWPYEGIQDESGRLPLASHGPRFDGTGMCKYRDTLEVIDEHCWLMTSELETEDGTWHLFMTARHTRVVLPIV